MGAGMSVGMSMGGLPRDSLRAARPRDACKAIPCSPQSLDRAVEVAREEA